MMLRADVAGSFTCFASAISASPALETIETIQPSRDVRLNNHRPLVSG